MKAQIDPGSLAQTFWAAVAAYVVVTAVFFAVVKLEGLEGSIYLHPLIFGNTGNWACHWRCSPPARRG